MYVCMYVCMCVCVCVYIYIYIKQVRLNLVFNSKTYLYVRRDQGTGVTCSQMDIHFHGCVFFNLQLQCMVLLLNVVS
jgi:hypothetical protein